MGSNLTKNDGLAELPTELEKWKPLIFVLIAGLFLASGISYYFSSATFTVPSRSQFIVKSPIGPVAKDQKETFVTPDDLKVPATFAQGSSSLTEKDKRMIKSIVIYLIQNPEASIYVSGYASSEGSVEINQQLAQARADVFKKYLVSNNIEESRIIASGKGVERPVASNTNTAGRKKDRRVEITFF